MLKEQGIKDLDTDDFKKVCRELLKAQVKVLGKLEDRIYGNYDDESQIVAIQAQPGTSAIQSPTLRTDTLQQAISDYWDEYGQDLKPRTKESYETYLKHILEHFEPKTQLHTIDYLKVKAFRDGLRSGEFSTSGKPLSASRINNYLMLLKSVYDLAMRKDLRLARNPAEGLRLKDKGRADEKRNVFTTDDLELLFIKSKEYEKNSHRKPETFWIPLLALYTGARLEEICQLLLTDIVERDGIWCPDIKQSDAPDLKSVKNSEQRIVPLHPFIVDGLHFIDFMNSVRPRSKNARVFPNLKRVNNRWGHGLGRWFSEFKTRAGIDTEKGKKTFHSFRHTFINFHKQHGTDMKYVKEVVGHTGGASGDITSNLYGKAFEPKILFDQVISKTDYPLDLSHLKKSKFVPRR